MMMMTLMVSSRFLLLGFVLVSSYSAGPVLSLVPRHRHQSTAKRVRSFDRDVVALHSSVGHPMYSDCPRQTTTSTTTNDQRQQKKTVSSRRATNNKTEEEEVHFLLKKYVTADGEVINPYRVLGVRRDAERQEIRKAYTKLARRYHPDTIRHRKVMPGRCNNEQDVVKEWGKISLSYQILSDDRSRKRFDRNEMVADPGSAFQRFAWEVTTKSVVGLGKGIVGLGSAAVDMIISSSSSSSVINNDNKRR
jgi:preprotein translocase subunit Sec63